MFISWEYLSSMEGENSRARRERSAAVSSSGPTVDCSATTEYTKRFLQNDGDLADFRNGLSQWTITVGFRNGLSQWTITVAGAGIA